MTRCFVLMELSSNLEMRSKANPRSLVFTIGFSAGVVGLAQGKGTKTNVKANAESLLIDTESGEASIRIVAQ